MLTLATTGTGFVKFAGQTGLVVPAGNNAQRLSTPELGETRYNTQAGAGLGFMETYNQDGEWQRSAGAGDEVTEDILKDLADLYILVLG
jgi:hypothetical protein